jgi:class 3 adenylate cyclase
MPRKRNRDRDKGEIGKDLGDELGEDLSAMIQANIRDRMRQKLAAQSARTTLPDGVVTIVFTDVEGSSELVRDLGDHEAHPILRRHDEVVRAVLAEHEGIEVERSGDAFMLVFRYPSKAVAFAVALHDRLAADGEVRVRIGMDTGEVIREEKGYFGRTVFRAARIAQLGDGGQVLASEATKVLAENVPGVKLVDMGERELDGLGDNHRVFEVVAVG